MHCHNLQSRGRQGRGQAGYAVYAGAAKPFLTSIILYRARQRFLSNQQPALRRPRWSGAKTHPRAPVFLTAGQKLRGFGAKQI